MSQHSSKSNKTPQIRRLKTPEERFGARLEPEIVEDSLIEEPQSVTENLHETKTYEVRRHEVKKHELKTHEIKTHERHTHERHVIPGHEDKVAPKPTVIISPRAKSRSKAAKKFAGRFIALGTAIFAVYMGIAALSAPQFRIKAIAPEGINETDPNQVNDLATKLVGQNIFRANKQAIEKAIETIPTVADAKIERLSIWPPKMRLVVTERKAVLRVGAGNSWWVVDETGKPFRHAEKKDDNLYALTAPQFTPADGKVLPEKWWSKAALLNAALVKDNQAALKEVGSTQGRNFWNLRRVYMDKDGLAALRINGSEMLVRLGEDGWDRKLSRARTALAYLDKTGRRAEELNLISYDYPRWKQRVASNQSDATTGTVRQSRNALS